MFFSNFALFPNEDLMSISSKTILKNCHPDTWLRDVQKSSFDRPKYPMPTTPFPKTTKTYGLYDRDEFHHQFVSSSLNKTSFSVRFCHSTSISTKCSEIPPSKAFQKHQKRVVASWCTYFGWCDDTLFGNTAVSLESSIILSLGKHHFHKINVQRPGLMLCIAIMHIMKLPCPKQLKELWENLEIE